MQASSLYAEDLGIVVVIERPAGPRLPWWPPFTRAWNGSSRWPTVDEPGLHQASGYIAAAERNGEVVGLRLRQLAGLHAGGPVGKTIVMSTTNGPRPSAWPGTRKLVMGFPFLNLSALCDAFRAGRQHPAALLGLAGQVQPEDSIFAGA